MDVTPIGPLRRRSGDTLVRVAAYAALACTGVSFITLVLTVMTIAVKDSSSEQLVLTVQSLHWLAVAVAWGLLFPVAVGLYRIAPSSATATAGSVLAGAGAVAVVVGALTQGTGLNEANPLSPYDLEAGEVAIGVWLLLVNYDLRKREILSRGLTQVGMVFGFGAAITAIGFMFNQRYVGAGLLVLVGFLVWPAWLGVVLLRPLPVTETESAAQS